jgi:hypothetical protein
MTYQAERKANKKYVVVFDPSYTFPLDVKFSDLQIEAGTSMGTWPNGMIFKDTWTNRYYRVEQQLQNIGRKAEAIPRIAAWRTNNANNPDLLDVRHEYYFWSIDQLIDEILRLGKLIGEMT